ncbi:hypothetical protein [Mycobacterium sp. PSTR-4-N]|uniref:hypothetical protein n=1 Tax=Mycobacterium sp. PSTR-4-N TaxID=2917745 RepID=UPI001F14B899|nr:hypothetical protein [Mycobacterium sp. PSTR-4-N]MCG7597147.1 hypothetical protein [Mycobacterium sp. PSTR-4-N]
MDGFTIEPEAAKELRGRLREAIVILGVDGLAQFQPLIHSMTGELPALVQLESRINWLYVTRESYESAVDEVLLSLVADITQHGRANLLTWATGALNRLPEPMLRLSGAWSLAQMCAALGFRAPEVSQFEPIQVDRNFLSSDVLPKWRLGFARDGATIEFGRIGQRRRFAIAVPATNPVLVWLSSSADDFSEETLVRIDVHTESPVQIPVGHHALRLRTLGNDVTELAAIEDPKPPEARELDETLDRLEGARIGRDELFATVVRGAADGTVVVRIDEEAILDAVMHRSFNGMPHLTATGLAGCLGERIKVRVDRVDRARQRVAVRRVTSEWSVGSLKVGDRVTGRLVGKGKSLLIFRLNEAAGVPSPEFEPLLAIARVKQVLSSTDYRVVGKSALRSLRSYPLDLEDEVHLTIDSIDMASKRIRVTLLPRKDGVAELPLWLSPGQRASAVVTTKSYAEIGLDIIAPHEVSPPAPSLRGSIVNSELTWLSDRTRWGDASAFPLKVGEHVSAVVLGLDPLRDCVRMSLKRVRPDPAERIRSTLRVGSEVAATLCLRPQKQGHWLVNIDPWMIDAKVSFDDFAAEDGHARMRVYATIKSIDDNDIYLHKLHRR